MVSDAKSATKTWLTTRIAAANLKKDNDATNAAFAVIYAGVPYPIESEFRASASPVDLLFCVGEPESHPLMTAETVPVPYGYEEHVPIDTYCIDKTGITGAKLKWKAEAELRRVAETYPLGSHRAMERRGDNDVSLGSTMLYSGRFTLVYTRDTT